MASPTEVVRKYFQKVDELKEINALVEKKRGELLELQAEEDAILKRHESAAQQIREDQEELAKRQAEFEASVDKSHLAFFYSVEELNEQAIEAKAGLGKLGKQIEDSNTELLRLGEIESQLTNQIKEKTKKLTRVESSIVKAQDRLESTLKKIEEAKIEYETTKQETSDLFKDAGELEKKCKHLDLMERRIRNYYKKAGLTYRP